MEAILFCNIGWMDRYEGNAHKRDDIVGGGSWVDENDTGHEVCNFLVCSDGYVYGHVETIRGELDRKIRIENIGGSGESADGVDVFWTATDPNKGGRRIVGWYRDATVFRERQKFATYPSPQHQRDAVDSYRIRALARNVRRLEPEERTLIMTRGKGWMGQTPWWTPSDESSLEVRSFVRQARKLLDGSSNVEVKLPTGSKLERNSPGAAASPYQRYVEAFELRITPRHDALQKRFESFLANRGVADLKPNAASVDLRYRDAEKGMVLAEVKPCEVATARYAIRTAMGQLIDYRQRAQGDPLLLIVLEVKPNEEDLQLATSNGFGLAYPVKDKFVIEWPRKPRQSD